MRIFRDIEKVVASMLAQTGKLIATGGYRLLLLIESPSIHDYNLIVHQISMALKEFFQIPAAPELGILSGKSFPENGRTLDELLPPSLR